MKKHNVLDIFAGAGGFSKGFEMANYDIVASVEFDKHAMQTYQANHNGTICFQNDISNVSHEEIKSKISTDIDVLIGGFPCQGFSIAGKREINDPRNQLPMQAIRFVREFQPKVFVMENVKGLLSMENGQTIDFIVSSFESCGYKVQKKLLKAIDFGIPQLRERLFIVGVRNDIEKEFDFPKPKFSSTNIEEFISNIEQTGTYEEIGLHNHDRFALINEEVYYKLGEGKFLCDVRHGEEHVHSWEIELKGAVNENEVKILNAIAENRRKKQYGPKDGNPMTKEAIQALTGLMDIALELETLVEKKYLDLIEGKYDIHDRKVNAGLRVFARNKPINTITTLSGVRSPYAHYSQPRGFTVRELARLQTFPDDFIFTGPIAYQYKQVGNAVPPLLAEKIAEQVREVLDNK